MAQTGTNISAPQPTAAQMSASVEAANSTEQAAKVVAKKSETMTAAEQENTKRWARVKEDKGDNLNNYDHAAV